MTVKIHIVLRTLTVPGVVGDTSTTLIMMATAVKNPAGHITRKTPIHTMIEKADTRENVKTESHVLLMNW